MSRGSSDLEDAGLRIADAHPSGRSLVVTVDFEAFRPASMPQWRAAMSAWAEEAAARTLPTVFFVSVEHVLRLRAADPQAHSDLIDGLRELVRGGAELQAHNHCAFDEQTGAPLRDGEIAAHVPGYEKRPSMFYDVVRHNGIPIDEWIPRVVASLGRLRAEAGQPEAPIAFRPGGWDSGGNASEIAAYVAALAGSGVTYDSSASHGDYGSRSWRVGLPFERNVFVLRGGVVEVATTSAWNYGSRRQEARALFRVLAQPQAYLPPTREGVLVPTLHFDHLVRPTESPRAAADRAARVVRTLARGATVLRLTPRTFGMLQFHERGGAEEAARGG